MRKDDKQAQYACAGALAFVGVLLMLILLPLNFKKVEYYQGCPGAGVRLSPLRGRVARPVDRAAGGRNAVAARCR